MSGLDRRHQAPEDLSVRVRRGIATHADQKALQRALDADPTLQIAHRVGCDFDRVHVVRAGDEALIQRAAEAALLRLSSQPDPTPRHKLRSPWGGAASAATCLGIAISLWFGVTLSRHRVVSAPAQPMAAAAPRVSQPLRHSADPVPDVSLQPFAASAGVPPRVERRATPPPRPARPQLTAAELFRRANAARRVSDFARAKRDYAELIARFPASEEARLARVSLGKVLLMQGESAAAAREFRDYLASGQGQLSEEALLSWAQSLRALHRDDDELRVWQQLLALYPHGIYAGQARKRVQHLAGSGVGPAR